MSTQKSASPQKRNRLKGYIGYGLGDMSSSMFWKVFSYYLPFFYSNVFGLTLVDAGVLVLVTRIWDAVSDPMMGIIADRTHTRWGKYRPYLLMMAPLFSVAGVMLFTTPDWTYGAKLVYAYATYLIMMTVYTGINVPYGAMLGVMTADPQEKTVYSSFRMFFAYGGSFVALAAWEPLVGLFKDGGDATAAAWQHAMMVTAAVCLVLFLGCFVLTRERLHTVSRVSIGADFRALLGNRPWWLLIGAALCFNLFCTVRGATVAYYFADIIGFDATLDLTIFAHIAPLSAMSFSILFYAGLFLSVGEVANMAGVAMTVPVAKRFGKKTTFIAVNAALAVLSVAFFFMPVTSVGFWLMLLLQVLISILTGIMSPLVWSMYADVSDYAELRFHTASTGLIFSSSSMAQKFGGAIGGAAVLWLLSACGYTPRTDEQIAAATAMAQPEAALVCLKCLMSFIPAAVACVAIVVCRFYPLTTDRVADISRQLAATRQTSHYLDDNKQ
ncbi:MAG: MFS transporter [Bacteroidaceae bacterium]|nr:MFS transporter [Bacteroidaceae bacterium]